ncbi:globin domain-containing protein [Rothia uropygioeca]|uniref:globin domain-containing protein n=1 Tax=Kocuria sp. 257 TaxID=2021970 RepID=UPI001012010F|nr:globin domain-containing protein [Kocuria sp. 257]
MLSDKARPVIEASLPIIAERIPQIASVFYEDMFRARPDLMDGLFSRSSQVEGTQPRALAGSIAVFAQWIIEHPDSYPDEVLSRIAHKHVSLGVPESEYQTVYTYLFGAIAKDLGESATEEIVDAWTEVYWLMAHSLISLERDLRARQANQRSRSPFMIIGREETGRDVVVLTLEPADKTPMTPTVAGQYISVFATTDDGLLQPRQFTLLPSGPNQRRIAVKRDADGEITPIMHRDFQPGCVIEISNPYGDALLSNILPDDDSPLYLFSAGIGITPMVAFLDELVRSGTNRRVTLIHAEHTMSEWALSDEALDLVRRLPQGSAISFMAEGGDITGRVDVSLLDIPSNAVAYLCGPLGFMQDLRTQLVDFGVSGPRIRYEIFGPDQWMIHDRELALV